MNSITTTRREQNVAALANSFAAANAFGDYMERKAQATLDAHRADLKSFAAFLQTVDIQRDPLQLQSQPAPWAAISHGLVSAFVRWLLAQGFSTSTVNRKLSTIKVYAGLAAKAGAIPAADHAMIRMVQGYSDTEAKRIDDRRPVSRISPEKRTPTPITPADAAALKLQQPDTPAGRRDALIFCLLADHGLRASEVIRLRTSEINTADLTVTFYRPKVDLTQTHRLTRRTAAAIERCCIAGDVDLTADALLLRKSRKDGSLLDPGLSRHALFRLTRRAGQRIGIDRLSPHDLRHFWATYAVAMGTNAFALRDAGGWKSLAMPSHYVASAEIANEHVLIP